MKTRRAFRILCGGLMAVLAGSASPAAKAAAPAPARGQCLVYVGTYTGAKSKGIYAYRFDSATGALSPLGLAAETPQPTFLAISPDDRFLYAANEVGEFAGKRSGAVSAFAINAETGQLALLNQAASGGPGPCHLIVDRAGKNVLVANYGGGSVAVLPIQAGGRLGEATAFVQHQGASVNRQRQQGPHAHSVNLDAANRFAFVADLGLDKVLVYRFDAAQGTLAANEPPAATLKPGAGPRHFAFHTSGRFAYVINELQSTVTAFSYDAGRGALSELQTVSTLPEGFAGNSSTAEVQVHRSGRFLYGSNRGHDSIAVFAIDAGKGTLTFVEHQPTRGKTPRNFGLDPTGAWLLAANRGSDSIVVFGIDQATGRLRFNGQVVEVGAPVCVKFVGAAAR